MVLDEESYDPLLPVEDRGRNAWVRTKVVEPTLGKRARDESQTSQPAAEPEFAGRRKLRRTASNKLGSQNSAIWTDIVGGGFAPAPNEQSAWASTENEPATGASGRPLSASAGQTTHTISVPIKPGGKENRHPGLELAIAGYTDTPTKHGIFHGLYFYLFGFDRKKVGSARLYTDSTDRPSDYNLDRPSRRTRRAGGVVTRKAHVHVKCQRVNVLHGRTA